MRNLQQLWKANNCYNYYKSIDDKIIDQKWIKSKNWNDKILNQIKDPKMIPLITNPFSTDKIDQNVKMNIKEFQISASAIKSKGKGSKNEHKGKVLTTESSPVPLK